jgi:thiamine-monophosphate kinase
VSSAAAAAEQTLGTEGEAALLSRIRRILGEALEGPGVACGIGDDAAVLVPPSGAQLVATVDMVVEGQHFRLEGPRASRLPDVGWRALAVNLSDVAAMGARPLWALCSLGLPPRVKAEGLEELYTGVRALAAAHGVAVVGGNLARVPERLVIDVTVIGQARSPILRSGARPGDLLVVTGSLGRAAAGLRLAEALARGGESAPLPMEIPPVLEAARLRPQPRVAEGIAVGGLGAHAVHAACDVSDGLAVDALRLCPPECGIVLWEDALPVDQEVRHAARWLGIDPLEMVLHGGEDYELLLAVAPESMEAVRRALGPLAGAQAIGQVAAGVQGLVLQPQAGGPPRPVPPRGWDPFR